MSKEPYRTLQAWVSGQGPGVSQGVERYELSETDVRIHAAQMVVNAGGSGLWLRHKLAEKEEPGALAAAIVAEAAVIADWLATGDRSAADSIREEIAAKESQAVETPQAADR